MDAVFHLFNTGDTTTQWIGVQRYLGYESSFCPFTRFDAWVNGEHVTFTRALNSSLRRDPYAGFPNNETPEWMIYQVTFPGHADTTIRIKYEAHLEHINGDGVYFYENSRHWMGKIGKVVFTMEASEIGGVGKGRGGVPSGFSLRSLSDNLVRFEARNVMPGPRDFSVFSHKPYPKARPESAR